MPSTTFLKTVFAVSLSFLSFTVFAQAAFSPGYIVKGNDTLHGYLKRDIEEKLIKGVAFSSNASGMPDQYYSAKDITAFSFDGGNKFVLTGFTDKTQVKQNYFAKYLLHGYYNLFSFREDEIQYFVVTRGDSSFLLYDDKRLNNGQLDEAGNYSKQLFALSVGCGISTFETEQLRYDEKSLIDYTKRLNQCKAPGSSSTSMYVKDRSEVKFYIYAGALPLGDKGEYTGRAVARFTLPSVSKHLSLNAGVSYMNERTKVKVNQAEQKRNISIVSAGVTIQNNFTSGTIQPYVEAGIGFGYQKDDDPNRPVINKGAQTDYGIELIGAIGIEAFVSKQLAIKADWRYELLTHYPTLGIAYFFSK